MMLPRCELRHRLRADDGIEQSPCLGVAQGDVTRILRDVHDVVAPENGAAPPACIRVPGHQIGVRLSRVPVVEHSQLQPEGQSDHCAEGDLVSRLEAGGRDSPVPERAIEGREVDVAGDEEAVGRHAITGIGIGIRHTRLGPFPESLLQLSAGADRPVTAGVSHLVHRPEPPLFLLGVAKPRGRINGAVQWRVRLLRQRRPLAA